MPAVIPVVVGAAAAAGVGATGLAVAGFTISATTAFAVTSSLTSLLVSRVMSNKSNRASFSQQSQGRSTVIRSSIESHKVIYGRVRTSGTLVFIETSDSADIKRVSSGLIENNDKKNQFIHMVVALAGHEVEEIESVFLNETELTLDGDNYATNSEYIGSIDNQDTYLARVKTHTGSTTQTADSDLVSEVTNWTSDHRLRGIAYVYVRLQYNASKFPNGIPQVRCIIKGKKVYDPRTTLTEYSNNYALCVRDYLTNSSYGLNASSSEIDDDSITAAANIADESVDLNPSGTESRYTCNGVIDTSVNMIDNLNSLTSAGAGAVSWTEGKFKVFAGSYDTPSVTIDEDWLTDTITVQARQPRQDLFNAVRGTFANPDKDWQPTDFAPITNSTYETQDGGEQIFRDIELPFTTSSQTAQRIAKILLEKSRQGIVATIPCNLKALQLSVWDTVSITIDQLGWSSKVFRVLSWDFNPEGGINLMVQEESSASYDWDESTDATVLDAAPDTNLPDPSTAAAPTNLTLQSGTAQLFLRKDGTVFSRIKASWTIPNDIFVTEGGYIEIQYKKSTASEYEKWGLVDGDSTFIFILDVEDGIEYDVRIRSINSRNVKSDFIEVTNYTVIGKTTPPEDVGNFTVFSSANTVVFKWSAVSDIDLSGYEIRFGDTNKAWENLTTLTKATKGTQITSAAVPSGAYRFAIKAVDTSGNFSANATYKTATITSDFDVINENNEQTLWGGTKTNFIRNPLRGYLEPDDQDTPSGDDFDVFNNYVVNPYATYTYETAEIDLGSDLGVRVNTNLVTELGAGETAGVDITDEADYKTAAGSYDGFEEVLSIGNVEARYFKFKITMDGTGGLAYIPTYTTILDAKERVESGQDSVSVSGTTISFATAYTQPPRVVATPVTSTALYSVVTNVTTSGFDAFVYNSSGTDVGGTINWTSTGV